MSEHENIIIRKPEEQSAIEKQLVTYCQRLLKLDKTGKGFIAGGVILSRLMRTKSDVDIFYNEEVEAENAYFQFKKEYDDHKFATPPTISKLVKHVSSKKNAYRVQLRQPYVQLDIVRIPFKSPVDCIRQFDFTIVMVAVDRDGNFYHHKNWYEHIAAKSLVVNELPFPVSTAWRVLKYMQKGFCICPTQYQKILTAVKNNTKPDDTLDGFYDAFD